MRRVFTAVVVMFVLFSGCSIRQEATGAGGDDPFSAVVFKSSAADIYGPRRFVWISYLDIAPLICTEEKTFRLNAEEMADNMASLQITDAFVQVRAFGDAVYPSDVFPSAACTTYPVLSEEFDAFSILLESMHAKGIRVHAWINPYRLHATQTQEYVTFTDALLAQDEVAVIRWGDGVYLNPASSIAKQTVIDGVREILENYPVDGIHFDDYFYPTTEAAFDDTSYANYVAEGGDMSLADFRRFHVSDLVSSIYTAVKQKDITLEFGVSPEASLSRNLDKHYANVQLWGASEGYVDYFCPQIYFGYENESMPFSETVSAWSEVCKSCDLIVGLGFYKVGTEDSYAGSGSQEWRQSFDIIARQHEEALQQANCSGVAFYRYASLFSPPEDTAAYVSLELYNLKKLA